MTGVGIVWCVCVVVVAVVAVVVVVVVVAVAVAAVLVKVVAVVAVVVCRRRLIWQAQAHVMLRPSCERLAGCGLCL